MIEVVHDCLEKRSSDQSSSLDSNNSLDILKNHVLNELIQTEKVYVRELFTVLLIASMNKKADFQMYEKYCLNKPRSEAIWKKYSECAFFQILTGLQISGISLLSGQNHSLKYFLQMMTPTAS
uniref:Vestigial like family member 1 n=1 Tax=Molossus molossus TaxID=27622 RepID=A0A7J8J8M9_MOLMO|nr:vestigial like family member 1 [Molossus molossus]